MSTSERKRSAASRLVPLLVVLVLLAGCVVAYYEASGFLDASGTWYGPLRVTSAGVTVSVETYMDVSTSLTGQLSGSGTFCLPLPFNQTASVDFSISGQHAFTLWSYGAQPPITLSLDEAVSAPLGMRLPIGPRLQLQGTATSSRFHLTGGDQRIPAALDLSHGSKAAFMTACHALAPLG